jgi:hypothetical protein
MASKFAVLCLL